LRDGCTCESRRCESEEDGEGDAVTNVQRLLRNELARASRQGRSISTVLPVLRIESHLTGSIGAGLGFAASIKMPRNAVSTTSDGGAVLGENGEIAE
jgi:hypothetical protein